MTAHRYDRVTDMAGVGAGAHTLLHLACACGHIDEHALSEHDWQRPGRARAHGRPVVCSCHGLEVATLLHRCPKCEDTTEHAARVRSGRPGLALVCKPCKRAADGARTIDPEVARASALRWYHAHGRERRSARTE